MKKNLILVIILAFILSFSIAVLLPYIPLYGEDIGLSVSMIGYVVAVFQFAQFVGRIPMGSFSDIFGYEKVIGFGGLCLFLSMVFYIISPAFWPILFLAQIMVGLAVCMEWVTLPSFVTSFGEGKVPIFTFITGWAYTLSVPLGGVLKDFLGMRFLFVLGFILSIPALIIVFLIMKNSSSKKNQTKTNLGPDLGPKSVIKMYKNAIKTLKSPNVLRASLYSFLMFLGFNIALSLFPLYLSGIGFSAAIIGGIQFSRMGTESTIRLLSKKIENKIKKEKIILLTTVFYGLSLLIISQLETLYLIVILSIIWGMTAGMYAPVVFEMIADGTEIKDRGKGMGIRGTMGTLGSFIGIIIFSNLAEVLSLRLAITLAGAFIVIGAIVLEVYIRSKNF